MNKTELDLTIKELVVRGKGILAADESQPTIAKRFAAIHIESTEENRRAYRELLFTAPKLEKYISGVILFEETLKQTTKDGIPFPEFLRKRGIVPGIKVDKGLVPLANAPDEKTSQGLDGLPERLAEYKTLGARFAKFRVVYKIVDLYPFLPSQMLIQTNAAILARYAAICQEQSIIPIVEPEVLIDGNYPLHRSAEITEKVLHYVFNALYDHKVLLEYMILKPNMVVVGKECQPKPAVEAVAYETIRVLRRAVPAAVPSINFLSGGQDAELATAHLAAIHNIGLQPWNISFSFARALQEPCLAAWQGNEKNKKPAQQALLERAKANSKAIT